MGRGSLTSFLASFGSGLSVIKKSFVSAGSGSAPQRYEIIQHDADRERQSRNLLNRSNLVRICAYRGRPGFQTYAGALVRRGEAEAEVTATGLRTKFGRTAQLVGAAHVVSAQQKAVLKVVGNLAAFNGVVITLLVAYSWYLKMPVADIIPLVLMAILWMAGPGAAHTAQGYGAATGSVRPLVDAALESLRREGKRAHRLIG